MKVGISIVVAFLSWVWLLAAFGQLMPRRWSWLWWSFPAFFTYAVVVAGVLGALVAVVNRERP